MSANLQIANYILIREYIPAGEDLNNLIGLIASVGFLFIFLYMLFRWVESCFDEDEID